MPNKLKFKRTRHEINNEEIENYKKLYKRSRSFLSPIRDKAEDEPITPPKKQSRVNVIDDEVEFKNRLMDLLEEDDDKFEAYIPKRWQTNSESSYLNTFEDNYNNNDDEEAYVENIRYGMFRKSNPQLANEIDRENDRKANKKQNKFKAKQSAFQEVRNDNGDQYSKSKANLVDYDNIRSNFNQYWLNPPVSITSKNIAYPIINYNRTIDLESIKEFIQINTLKPNEKRKILLDLMKIFHPDKFNSKFKAKINDQDQYDEIMKNVENIAKILIHLLD